MVDCIVMAGGRGSRLGGVEKPLLEVCGKPMLARILETAGSICRRVLLVYSRHTRGLELICRSSAFMGLECVEGSGEGYAMDLREALTVIQPPVLVLPADMPHITREYLEDFLVKAMASPGTIVNLVTGRGPTGISLFKGYIGQWWDIEYPDTPALFDIDTPHDLKEAEEACI